jgi:hypothetical protein
MVGFVGHVPSGVPKFWAPVQPVNDQVNVSFLGQQRPGPIVTRVAMCMALCAPPAQAPVFDTGPSVFVSTCSEPVFAKPIPYQAYATLPPPAPAAAVVTPSVGWLQPFAIPPSLLRRIDTNAALAWNPQAIAVIPNVGPPYSAQPGPVFSRPALSQSFATPPPQITAVVVTPTVGWLAPFAVPPSLLRRIDTNTAWVPQPSFNAAPTNTLEWLQPFPVRFAPRPFYDLNNTWVPQPSFNAPTPSALGWLQPFNQRTAPRPVYDLNSGYVPQPPAAAAPTPSTLGWLQPFPTRTAPRPFYDLNPGWVPQVPAAVVAAPPIGWLANQFVQPPRPALTINVVLAPFSVPAPTPTQTPSTLEWLQPFPTRTAPRPFYDLNSGWVPQVPSAAVVSAPPETDVPQFGPVFTKQALYQAFATLPPQAPAAAVVAPSFGWFQAQDVPRQPARLRDTPLAWVPKPSFNAPTPANLEWLQALSLPRQPIQLRDINSGWVPQAAPTFTITPSTWGWYQPFPVPPQPPRRPIFIEFYVPQNVGGTRPIPPVTLMQSSPGKPKRIIPDYSKPWPKQDDEDDDEIILALWP